MSNAQLITESLIIYQSINEDGSSELAITTQTNPQEGDAISYAVVVGQVILKLFEDGTILDHVNALMGLAGPDAIILQEVPA